MAVDGLFGDYYVVPTSGALAQRLEPLPKISKALPHTPTTHFETGVLARWFRYRLGLDQNPRAPKNRGTADRR